MIAKIFACVGVMTSLAFLTLSMCGLHPYQAYSMEIRLFLWPASLLYIGGGHEISATRHIFAISTNTVIFALVGFLFDFIRSRPIFALIPTLPILGWAWLVFIGPS